MQVWQYRDDFSWSDFPEEQQVVLRRQFGVDISARFTMTIGNNWRGEPNNYSIDLVAQTQTNDSSSTVRDIRRREAERWTCVCTTVNRMDCRVCPVCSKSRAGHLEDLPESAPGPSARPDATASGGRTAQLLQSLTHGERRYLTRLLVGTLVKVHLPTGTETIALPGTHSSPTVSNLQHEIARARGADLGGANRSQREAYQVFLHGEQEPQPPDALLDNSHEYFCLMEATDLDPGPFLLIDTQFDELTDTTAGLSRFFGLLGSGFVKDPHHPCRYNFRSTYPEHDPMSPTASIFVLGDPEARVRHSWHHTYEIGDFRDSLAIIHNDHMCVPRGVMTNRNGMWNIEMWGMEHTIRNGMW